MERPRLAAGLSVVTCAAWLMLARMPLRQPGFTRLAVFLRNLLPRISQERSCRICGEALHSPAELASGVCDQKYECDWTWRLNIGW